MPQIGEIDGVHCAVGYGGSGTVIAPYLGAKAGFRAAGPAGGETAYADTHFRTRWLHPSPRPHFSKAADNWYFAKVGKSDNAAPYRPG